MSAYVPEIISAVVGLIAAWRVPTLRRRVRDHTKLLAEVPLELQGPVKGLLREELATLVRRDRRRMTRLGDLAAALVAGMAAFSMTYFVVIIAEIWAGADPLSRRVSDSDILVMVMVASAALVVAGGIYIGRIKQRGDA